MSVTRCVPNSNWIRYKTRLYTNEADASTEVLRKRATVLCLFRYASRVCSQILSVRCCFVFPEKTKNSHEVLHETLHNVYYICQFLSSLSDYKRDKMMLNITSKMLKKSVTTFVRIAEPVVPLFNQQHFSIISTNFARFWSAVDVVDRPRHGLF